MEEALEKGAPVLAAGELQLNQWTAQDGSSRQKVFLSASTVRVLAPRGSDDPAPSFKDDDVPF